MNLFEANFGTLLCIESLKNLSGDQSLILCQLGFCVGDVLEKVHAAPLGDPITVRIGEQLYSLRKEICEQIQVQAYA